jgi:aromatic ring-cleaving dioxygenase
MPNVTGYHAHVYFDATTLERAQRICSACRDAFGVTMGRVHERPVGPHPDWSCQLAFGPERLGDIVGWLSLNREGLTVLIHPETGDAVKDHSAHAIWMGEVRPLDLAVLQKS